MELVSINAEDPLWIAIAFFCGLLAKSINLPPLIGFLSAGFILNGFGASAGEFLDKIADLGVTLLLFTIGLKLKIKELFKPEVIGAGTLHMTMITTLFAGFIILLSAIGLPLFTDLDLKTSFLIAFALSFSSTVFAVKILEELGDSHSNHGKISIGILVVQDIIAVSFLVISANKVPSIWALGIILLIPLRPILYWLLEKIGHGELLVLFGITMALGGADIFEIVGIKADLGALVFGMIMANHPKSRELAKSLLSFKDIFLVGFFLSIGMTALPGTNEILAATILLILIPLKIVLFFGTFNLFCLRSSTSWRASLNLGNYSEFGLIVGMMSYSAGWLNKEWLAVFAIALSLSFIISAQLVNIRDKVYQNWRNKLKSFERAKRLPGEEDVDLSHVRVIIFGMGRMGSSVYKVIGDDFKDDIIGVDVNLDKVQKHQNESRNVVHGDATNPDFWTKSPGLIEDLEWVLLTLSSHSANITIIDMLREMGYTGKIVATSSYKDECEDFKKHKIDFAYNIYEEAGVGFANELKKQIDLSLELKKDD